MTCVLVYLFLDVQDFYRESRKIKKFMPFLVVRCVGFSEVQFVNPLTSLALLLLQISF